MQASVYQSCLIYKSTSSTSHKQLSVARQVAPTSTTKSMTRGTNIDRSYATRAPFHPGVSLPRLHYHRDESLT